MKVFLKTLALLLLPASGAYAQMTTVTATVTDPNSFAYKNGSYEVTFVPWSSVPIPSRYNLNGSPFTQDFTGTLDSTGTFTVTLADSNVILPRLSTWQFHICSLSGSCFFYTAPTGTVTGSSVNLSTQISSVAVIITASQSLSNQGFNFFAQPSGSGYYLSLKDAFGHLLFSVTQNGTVFCALGCGGGAAGAVLLAPTVEQDIVAGSPSFPLTITSSGMPTLGEWSSIPLLDTEQTFSGTVPSGGGYTPFQSIGTVSGATFSNSGQEVSAAYHLLELNNGATSLNGGGFEGDVGEIDNNGTASDSLSHLYGGRFAVYNNSSGNGGHHIGLFGASYNVGTGTVPFSAAFYADSPDPNETGAATVTHNYGFYAVKQNLGATTPDPWGFYDAGAAAGDRSYLGPVVTPGLSSLTAQTSAYEYGINTTTGKFDCIHLTDGDCLPFGGSGFTAGGDLSGSSSSQEVIGILSHTLPSLTTGYLNWNGSAWVFSSGGSMTWPSTPGITVCTGTPCTAWGTSLTAPSGAIVGTTDTQTLTNKTLDGVTPTTMGYVDPTSSIQTQLNGKQASLGYTPANVALSNLSGTPTLCSGGQFSQGISSGNNNCATPSGSGISGLTTRYIPQAGSSTTIVNSSPVLDNGVSAANTLTYAGTGGVSVPNGPVGTGSDGVHPSYVGGVGNTTLPTVGSNGFLLVWPNVATFTAWTMQVPSSIPANGDLFYCAVTGTNCLLTDSSIPYSNVVTQASNGATADIAGYAGSNKVLSPVTALPNGITATTQTTGDNTTKVATDAFVIANAGASSLDNVYGGFMQNPVTGRHSLSCFFEGNQYQFACDKDSASGNSGQTFNPVAATATVPGYGEMATIATINSFAYVTTTANRLFAAGNSSNVNNLYFVSGNVLEQTTNIRAWICMTANTGTTQLASSAPTGSFACFRYDTSASDTVWEAVTSASGVSTVTSTGVAPNTSFHIFEISWVDASNEILFRIDNTTVATVTTDLPAVNTALSPYDGVSDLAAAATWLGLSQFYASAAH